MPMRVFIISLTLILFFSIGGIAQPKDQKPGDWITINLDMTDSMTIARLGFDVKSKLATKIINIVSRNGNKSKVSCVRNKSERPSMDLTELNTGILCRPKLEIYDEEIVDTGMEKLVVVKASLTIIIQSMSGDVIFATLNREYQGSGRDTKSAINNAIINIPVRSKIFVNFLAESRSQIIQYYNQICETIIQQANTLVEFKHHVDAIVLLWPIPHEVKCHAEARDRMISIYKEYVEYNCSKFLFQARTYITNKEYGNAMRELRKIDAEASCVNDAITLMEEIASKVDDQEKLYMDLYRKMREDDHKLEMARYGAMQDMTTGAGDIKIEIERK